MVEFDRVTATDKLGGPPTKRQKRSVIACRRCHSLKIKCSGDAPCTACANSGKGDVCEYPVRERKVTISESYLKRLQSDLAALKRQPQGLREAGASETPRSVVEESLEPPTPGYDGSGSRSPRIGEASVPGHAGGGSSEPDVVNPLFDTRPVLLSSPSSTLNKPPFIGEAACAAFGDRLLHCVNKSEVTLQPANPRCIRHRAFNRMTGTHYKLPDRVHAQLLLQVAMRFIGNDQHLFLHKAFMDELESVYNGDAEPNPVWLCKLFALLALGEMYSSRRRQVDERSIPGTSYFIEAIGLLQDLYEDATVTQVEILVVLACYANALGRVRSAYTYSGIAMRTALGLGMHRATAPGLLSAVEQESRRRTWWSLYVFDRLTCSKLGQPINVHDEDIDVQMPSMDGLTLQEQQEFSDPSHLCASVGLARITGNILTDIYRLPGRNKGTFVHGVHRILNSLREWDRTLAPNLIFHWDTSPRHVASLHLAYNQCILQTARPILLYLFKTQFQLGVRITQETPPRLSPMTVALADTCVSAAHTSNIILSKLFVNGSLATLGYWDAHYIFSSTLILIMSAVMEPRRAISDAVQVAFNLLRSMRDDGNIPASDYFDRLAVIQKSVQDMRETATHGQGERLASGLLHQGQSAEAGMPHVGGWTDRGDATRGGMDIGGHAPTDEGSGAFANPHIHNFLADKSFGWPPTSDTFPDADILQQFTRDLADDFNLSSF